ncbi:MAG: hypothetical protein Q7S31_03545, partial [bacterium]|nr:hypothetical protein [bacterium]
HDSSVTLFSFWSLASFLQGGNVWPGISLALAFLAKPLGLLVGVGWLVTRKWKQIIIAGLCFIITLTIVWPQSWKQPLIAVGEYLWRQTQMTSIPLPNFYAFPNWTYYPFQFIFRTPEAVLVGLVLAGWFYIHQSKTTRFWSQAAYCAFLLLVLSLAVVRTGIRYALPLLPWIYVAAGWGISQINRRWAAAIYLGLLLVPLVYYPNYYLYYNRLIGGPESAKKFDMVGLCLGNKAALEYLDQQQIPGVVAILGCADSGPYHTGRVLTKDLSKADIVVLESAHQQVFPASLAVLSLQKRQLLNIIKENGVITAYIYRR